MPIYEFSCGECNNRFEELVFTHCEGVTCPRCQSNKVVQHLSTFSVGASGSSVMASEGSWGGCSTGSCCPGGTCGM
jgi:putative FmdB family regulatory protein